MELPRKKLEHIACKTRPKIEDQMWVVMDKSTHEEHLFQPLQTNSGQFKIVVTFLTGYNRIFNITIKKNKLFFTRSIKDDYFIQAAIPPGAYEIEKLENEFKQIIIGEGHSIEDTYPYNIKPNVNTMGSNIKNSSKIEGSQIGFNPNNIMGDILGFEPQVLCEEYNSSEYPVDIFSFDTVFFECDIAQGMIYKYKRTRMFHNFTMDVDPGYEYIEKFRVDIQWFMNESKDSISKISFRSENENIDIVSIFGQIITFRLWIKVI